MTEKILILDFGSQYTQLIARRVRELNIYSEIVPFSHSLELTEDIEYEEDEDVEVNLPSSTKINTLDHLNKVIKYMLEETTIKLQGISAEEFVAGKN